MKRAFVLLLLAGCPDSDQPPDVHLYAMTGPPPASKGAVINDETNDIHSVELSVGVAIAARCSSSCVYDCSPKLTVDDEAVLHVRPVYRQGGNSREVALVAKQAGTTVVRVDAGCTTRSYVVTVR